MRLIENDVPTPRLLTSAANEYKPASSAAPASTGKLHRSGEWTGNAFAIFAGIALGGILICSAATFFLTRHAEVPQELAAGDVLVAVTRQTPAPVEPASAPAVPEPTPSNWRSKPLTVQITPEMFRVSAISLGHPKLAVINRQQVAEGDWIEVKTPTASVAVKLHVIKIVDGAIQIEVGNQVLTVEMEQIKFKPL